VSGTDESSLGTPVAATPPVGRTLGAPGASVVIISGPSGVGKDTIIHAMQQVEHPERHYVITCTTRDRRWYEEDGVDYHFLTQDAFDRIRGQDGFLEASEVHGKWYGTPRDQVAAALAEGKDAILKIDVQGAHAVNAIIPEALLVFVVPPSLDELRRRLVGRATEVSEALERRWHNAAYELLHQDEYDHVVTNHTGQADQTAQEIEAIIAAEHAANPDRRLLV
jgi:guanylate kinase